MKKNLKIKNKCGMDLSQTEELFHDLCGFAQKRFGFKKPPTLHLISDIENASKPLGKTAYYDPQGLAITIYTDNRHTKDILRSLAHELVHHTQNENGMLNDTGYHGSGYAQKNKDLRQSEKEAYLKGNMCFRDWEDGLKESKPTIYNEWRINNMSNKKWKNNELMENVTKKFGFKMDLSQLNEASCGSKKDVNEGEKNNLMEEPMGYLLPTGEFLPLGSPEAKKYEAELLKGFRMKAKKSFPAMTPTDPKKMYRIDSEGNRQPMFPDMMKEEKECPECKGKGKDCKCPDLKEEKDEKNKKGSGKDVTGDGKYTQKDRLVNLGVLDKDGNKIKKEGMTETKLRGVIRKIILSEMKRK